MRYVFYHDWQRVGEFPFGFPRSAGVHAYNPTGPANEAMITRLLERGSAKCHYDDKDTRVFFTVVHCPIHGMLEINDYYLVPLSTGSNS